MLDEISLPVPLKECGLWSSLSQGPAVCSLSFSVLPVTGDSCAFGWISELIQLKINLTPPQNGNFLLTAKCVVTNAVIREKMGMQGLGREGGTALQMHRSSSGWLRALRWAVYDQDKYGGKISWHRHSCAGKTVTQYGDTRIAMLKELPKHVLGLLPECWHCHHRSYVEDNYLHLSLNHRHSLNIPWCW